MPVEILRSSHPSAHRRVTGFINGDMVRHISPDRMVRSVI